jgi:hypothetical protein
MNRYSGGNSVLRAGAFVLPILPLTIMSAMYGDVMLHKPNLEETALLWVIGWMVSYLLIVIHESGHLLAARLVGIEIARVTIGHWRKLASFSVGKTQVFLRAAPSSGYVMPKPVLTRKPTAAIVLFVLGGVLAEGAVVALALARTPPPQIATLGELVVVFVRINVIWIGAYQVIFNLLPGQGWLGGTKVATDGMLLLQLWQNRGNRAAEDQMLRELQGIEDLKQAGQYDAAIGKATALMNVHPKNLELRKFVASLHSSHGDWREAERMLREMLQEPPDSKSRTAELLDLLACLPLYTGCMDLLAEADAWTTEALNHVPNAITLKGTRGGVLVELGRLDEGIAMLNDVMKWSECPVDHAISAAYLAKAHAARENFGEARRWLAKAESIEPKHPVITRIAREISTMTRSGATC